MKHVKKGVAFIEATKLLRSDMGDSIYDAVVKRGYATRKEALAMWNAITAVDPHFFDSNPGERSGPPSDNEKVEVTNQGFALLLRTVLS